VCVCGRVCVCVCVCLRVRARVHVHVCVRMRVSVRWSVRVFVFAGACVCMRVSMCCVCSCICLCVCIRVCLLSLSLSLSHTHTHSLSWRLRVRVCDYVSVRVRVCVSAFLCVLAARAREWGILPVDRPCFDGGSGGVDAGLGGRGADGAVLDNIVVVCRQAGFFFDKVSVQPREALHMHEAALDSAIARHNDDHQETLLHVMVILETCTKRRVTTTRRLFSTRKASNQHPCAWLRT